MLFVIHALDKAGDGSARKANRDAHLAFAGEHAAMIRVGGPLLSDDGQSMVGSMLVIEADDMAAAKAWAAKDPYAVNGVFERVDIRPYRAVLGTTEIS
jgi:uncharacterized protein YciI